MSKADGDGGAVTHGVPLPAQAASQGWSSTGLSPKLGGDGGAEQCRDLGAWVDEDTECCLGQHGGEDCVADGETAEVAVLCAGTDCDVAVSSGKHRMWCWWAAQ
eukprot:3941537-Rhodomonas_salina.16